MVELALVLPIFFAVVLGVVEFGRAMMVSQMVNNAAREGTRMAIIDGSTNSDVDQWIRSFLYDTIKADPNDVNVSITITPAPGNNNPGNQLAAAQPRDLCKVEVDVPFDKVQYIAGKYLQGKSIRALCAMRHE